MTYAILCHPGRNRVYFEASLSLSEPELTIAAEGLRLMCDNIRREKICGVEYLLFDTDIMDGGDAEAIWGLSFTYCLFELVKADGVKPPFLFKPVGGPREPFVDYGVSSILKYTGKTNEIFTRMMLNLACSAGGFVCGERLALLDPVAGKGTTLYEGLIRGFDVYGIEIADGVVNEVYHFMKRYLETARYRFNHSSIKVSGPDKSFSALRHTFDIARSKEEAKAGGGRAFEITAGSSAHAGQLYKKGFFDIIAGDLPYGVQHGSVSKEGQSSVTRNPAELLAACLPAWARVLKRGGVAALSWNVNVLPRDKMILLLTENGLTVKNDGAYLRFAHRVDQAITRDIVIAVKE